MGAIRDKGCPLYGTGVASGEASGDAPGSGEPLGAGDPSGAVGVKVVKPEELGTIEVKL